MDHDELVSKRVHAIARTHGCSIDAVHAALDEHPIAGNRDAYLNRTLALERCLTSWSCWPSRARKAHQRGPQRPLRSS
jgi:putative NIF3 family GTP cyclohydrolase 1 type 2